MEETVMIPITVVKEVFSNKLVELINSSQLPLFIVEYVMKDALAEVHVAAMKQLQEDAAKYSEESQKQMVQPKE